MIIRIHLFAAAIALLLMLFSSTQPVHAQEDASKAKPATKQDDKPATDKAQNPISVKVAQGNIQFSASGLWKSVPPRSNMLEAELKIPRVEGDSQDGRLTIMGAGGSIDANIDRWIGQFVQPDGSDTADKTKQSKKEIAGQTVNLVDITGTFMDAVGGPFSGKPKVERENYRMLAAIVQTEANGNYFVKLYVLEFFGYFVKNSRLQTQL